MLQIWKWRNKEGKTYTPKKKSITFHGKKSDYFGKPKIKEEEMSPLSKVYRCVYTYSFAAKVEEISETDIDE